MSILCIIIKCKDEQKKITAIGVPKTIRTGTISAMSRLPGTKLKYKLIDNHLNIYKLAGCKNLS